MGYVYEQENYYCRILKGAWHDGAFLCIANIRIRTGCVDHKALHNCHPDHHVIMYFMNWLLIENYAVWNRIYFSEHVLLGRGTNLSYLLWPWRCRFLKISVWLWGGFLLELQEISSVAVGLRLRAGCRSGTLCML